jgi:hypothetical protein
MRISSRLYDVELGDGFAAAAEMSKHRKPALSPAKLGEQLSN